MRSHGSTLVLAGLTGLVTSTHPIAIGWVKLLLDANEKTAFLEWSISADSLVLLVE
jgi:hypothetical protein